MHTKDHSTHFNIAAKPVLQWAFWGHLGKFWTFW
jgi:hypothetical protein